MPPRPLITASSTNDMTISLDLDAPAQRALLALDLAGFHVARAVGSDLLLKSDTQEGFELTFEREDGSLFTLTHDPQEACFEVEERLSERPDIPGEMALLMNACLAPQRRIARDPSTQRLMVCSVLNWDQAEVGRLAEELTAVAEIAQALRDAKPAEPSEPMRPETLGLRA